MDDLLKISLFQVYKAKEAGLIDDEDDDDATDIFSREPSEVQYGLSRQSSAGDISSRVSRFKLDESLKDSLACAPESYSDIKSAISTDLKKQYL